MIFSVPRVSGVVLILCFGVATCELVYITDSVSYSCGGLLLMANCDHKNTVCPHPVPPFRHSGTSISKARSPVGPHRRRRRCTRGRREEGGGEPRDDPDPKKGRRRRRRGPPFFPRGGSKRRRARRGDRGRSRGTQAMFRRGGRRARVLVSWGGSRAPAEERVHRAYPGGWHDDAQVVVTFARAADHCAGEIEGGGEGGTSIRRRRRLAIAIANDTKTT